MAMVMGLSVFVVASALMVSELNLVSFKDSSKRFVSWQLDLENKKALSLAGYFVAHNLVLCREGGWKELGRDVKCRWGGTFHNPPVDQNKFGIKSVNIEDRTLVLTLSNTSEDKSYNTKLSFTLANWSEDASFRGIVGEIPTWNAIVDDDRFVVFMSAVTKIAGTDYEAASHGAVRRPIATPNLIIANTTGRESCVFDCISGSVLNPYPECRGPLGVPPGGNTTPFTVRVTNLGPGAVYKLKYERTTAYEKTAYPNKPDEVAMVDVLPFDEVLMPGGEVLTDLQKKCFAPIRRYTTETRTVTDTTGTTSSHVEVNLASSFRKLSSEYFGLSTSRFKESDAARPGFMKSYNPYDPRTFTPNPSKSELEPKRAGVNTPTLEVSGTSEIITETTVVVRPRNERFSQGGDGDGDGGN